MILEKYLKLFKYSTPDTLLVSEGIVLKSSDDTLITSKL